MRVIHTADWHLGRIFLGVCLTEDQAYLLDEFVELARSARPDVILVAGDIYDRAVPPPEAVALLDDVLSRLVLDVGTSVVLIAGNHDSPERLAFLSRVLGQQKLHVLGSLSGPATSAEPGGPSTVLWPFRGARVGVPLTLEDRHGPVEIWAIPYADPPSVREWLGDAQEEDGNGRDSRIHDHDTAMRAVLERLETAHRTPDTAPPVHARSGRRSILLTHAFVAGGTASESERPLTLGGAGMVDPALFRGFTYVALGHLHRPQQAGDERVRYAGSLFKYSFDEADHAKTVDVVALNGDGTFSRESVPLRPRRDVRRIAGRFADLLRGPGADGSPVGGGNYDDYLLVTLLDDGPILDAMARLREVYPNVLRIERAEAAGLSGGAGRPADAGTGGGPGSPGGDIRHHLTERELFGAFFADVTGQRLTGEQQAVLDDVLEDLRRAEREA